MIRKRKGQMKGYSFDLMNCMGWGSLRPSWLGQILQETTVNK